MKKNLVRTARVVFWGPPIVAIVAVLVIGVVQSVVEVTKDVVAHPWLSSGLLGLGIWIAAGVIVMKNKFY